MAAVVHLAPDLSKYKLVYTTAYLILNVTAVYVIAVFLSTAIQAICVSR